MMTHPFDDMAPVEITETEAWGPRWTVYWDVGESEPCLFQSGPPGVTEIPYPYEWQALFYDAMDLVDDEGLACDLACDRMQRVLARRGQFSIDPTNRPSRDG